ncbi:MAG: hypothetical protein O3C04_01790 [Crenarchaeota archaeon]|nr:hypothetical protein [Thermoproteota archaeon]MDA1124362.1 hypothetical protein [Thermoproteota archaeon]
MSESSPIKDALYAKINDIGQEEIHQLLLNGKFSELFEKIYEPVINGIEDIDEYKKHGTLAESLTHYLFTEMLIPSQRKVVFENIELDMIIPSMAELQKDSHNSIVIVFVKTSNIEHVKQRIENIKKVQKEDRNIWTISKEYIEIPQSRYKTEKESFGNFLKDTQNFIKTKKRNKLNIFKTDF